MPTGKEVGMLAVFYTALLARRAFLLKVRQNLNQQEA